MQTVALLAAASALGVGLARLGLEAFLRALK
jgi:hypothetical protein